MAEKKPTKNIVIAPPPPPPGTEAKRKALGVPEDYRATAAEQYRPPPGQVGPFLPAREVAPRYFEGHEYLPASFPPEKIARLQRELATAGLIGPKTKFRVGLWDEPTRAAYKNLLEYANAAGLDERTAIKRYAEAQILDPTGEDGGRAPLTIKKTNPSDLIAIADTVARATIGRKLRPEEAARLAGEFQAKEVAEQTTDYAQAETGGTSVAAPDPDVFLAERIRQEYGVEAGAADLADQGNEFFKLLNEVGG